MSKNELMVEVRLHIRNFNAYAITVQLFVFPVGTLRISLVFPRVFRWSTTQRIQYSWLIFRLHSCLLLVFVRGVRYCDVVKRIATNLPARL